MELKPGYKQTEAGVIPEDWDVCRLDSLGAGSVPPIKAGPFGSSLTKDTYVSTGFKVYGQEQVIRGDYLYGDYFIPLSKYRKLESCAVSPGDVLLSLVGTTGKLLVVPDDAPAGVINPRLIRFSFDKKRVCPQFFKDLFETGQVQSFLARYAQGGTMGVLNAGMLRPIGIPLPTLNEQRVIAEALSDADALIESLEQLVTKKRHLKQGAIRELLTGEKRLPGFSGEWKIRTIDSFSTFITKGATPTTYGFNWQDDGVLFLRSECVSADGLDLTQSMFISEAAHVALNRGEVREGDLLMTITGNVGRVVRLPADFGVANINQHIARIRINATDVSPGFVFHFLSQAKVRAKYALITTGQAYPQISLKQVRETLVPLPSRAEQTAIATILSDMDAEIADLESQLAKTRSIKQGMMRKLLTGEIRLR